MLQLAKFLDEKFSNNNNPNYVIKEITEESLEYETYNSKYKTCKMIGESSLFQVMVFTPNSEYVKAATRLCIYVSMLSLY